MRQMPPRAEFSVRYAGANLSTDFFVKKGKDYGAGYTIRRLSEIDCLGLQDAKLRIAGAHFNMMIATFGLKRWMIA